MTPLYPIAIILGCQLLGEISRRLLGLSIPGPVIGMIYMLVVLVLFKSKMEGTIPFARLLLANMSLLFVPAGVGVMANLDILAQEWLPLLVILIVSTIIALVVSVVTFLLVQKLMEAVR